MRIIVRLLILLAFFRGSMTEAQDGASIDFGNVRAADFDLSKYNFDKDANAVVISDLGRTEFEGSNKDWFLLVHKRKKRIKILNKNGFDAATETIDLWSGSGGVERLQDVKATTYNLEDNKVHSAELDQSSIFTTAINQNVTRRTFTLPAVKAGSIVEISYTIVSDYLYRLRPWAFQGEYPEIYSEYEVEIPQFFYYVFHQQGYLPIENTQVNSYRTYHVFAPREFAGDEARKINVQGNTLRSKWFVKNVPALKAEKFTTTLVNHISRIEFQLSQFRWPDETPENVLPTWAKLNELLLKNDLFGAELFKNNNWLNDAIGEISSHAGTTMDKAMQIYQYVRDHFTCTNRNSYFASASLRTIFERRSGSVADINLLLIAMLNHEGVTAHPVILSTRGNGVVLDNYPTMFQMNYVIAEVQIGDSDYYVDATREMGFGKLPTDCYNGWALRVSTNFKAIYLTPDSLNEEKISAVTLTNTAPGTMKGTYDSKLGYYESLEVRSLIKQNGLEKFEKSLREARITEAALANVRIDSLKELEKPLALHFNMTLTNKGETNLYFNPMFGDEYADNPFKSAERVYPVEMPYTINRAYTLKMDIPAGYEVDELPEPAKVRYNQVGGYFEYAVTKTADRGLELVTKLVVKKTNISPKDYNGLREFFAYVIKKQAQQIVFKKRST